MTHGVLFSAVEDVQVEVLQELLESVILQLTEVWFSLGNGSDESSKESKFHLITKDFYI